MSSYTITAYSIKDVSSPLKYSAVVYNRTHITKVILPGAYSCYIEGYIKPFMNFTVEINGKTYYTDVPVGGYPSFDTDIFLEQGDTLSITVISTSVSSEYVLMSVSVDIHSGHAPGWYCPKGFFAIIYEGTRYDMWTERADDYPILNGVTAIYPYYDNYKLPYSHKYKIISTVNDGYPFVLRVDSGWTFAYPYIKLGAWSNAAVYVKDNGVWKSCNSMMYDEKSALYKHPDIKSGWKIEKGKNDGYPYVVYENIPFYEEE